MSRTTITFFLGISACIGLFTGIYISSGYYCSVMGGSAAWLAGLGTGVCGLLAYDQGGNDITYCLHCDSRLGGDCGDAEFDFDEQFCSQGCYDSFRKDDTMHQKRR